LSEKEGSGEEDDDEDEDEDEDEEMPEAGPSTLKSPAEGDANEGPDSDEEEGENEGEDEEEQEEQAPVAPPKIMITTSPSPCKLTYQFCDELKNVFPGGEFFKRPRGKGFELGRLGRWGIKRGFGAVIVVNEDHKAPSESRLVEA